FYQQANIAQSRPVSRRGFNRGGVVPGTGTGDIIPANLEPGEFVIRKDSAKQIGYERLAALNAGRYASGGRVRRLAGGGSVGTRGFSYHGIPSYGRRP